MTPEQLIAIGAAALSLLLEYLPPFSNWYEGLEPGYKRLFMAGLLFVLVGVIFGLSCAGLLGVFVCSWVGAGTAFVIWLEAIAINQGVHLVFKK